MALIEIEHRGLRVHYSENEDVWRCSALDVEGITLTAVKRKIDVIERKSRSVESIEAIRVGYADSLERVVVTAKVGKSATGRSRYWDDKNAVWCVNPRNKTRSRVSLGDLVENTPENRAKLDDYTKLVSEAKVITDRAKAILAAIPRMSADAVPAEDKETED